jgi:hypothetical protein
MTSAIHQTRKHCFILYVYVIHKMFTYDLHLCHFLIYYTNMLIIAYCPQICHYHNKSLENNCARSLLSKLHVCIKYTSDNKRCNTQS